MAAEGNLTLDTIARTVCDVESNLKDRLETAVILEVLGYKDADARALGYADLFELADAVKDVSSPYGVEEPLREQPKRKRSGIMLYAAGMFYNLGWVIMVIALLMGGQSLWAARDMPIDVSTAMGLGVVIGLVCTGGIQQFAAWKFIYYHLQENAPLARFVMRRSLRVGALIVAVAAVGLALVATLVVGLPIQVALLGVLYLVFIGAFRLASTPAFALRKFVALIVISIAALVGMFSSYWLLSAIGFDRVTAVVLSQFIGLALLIVSGVLFLYFTVFAEKKAEAHPDVPPFYAKKEAPRNVKEPKFWVLVYEGFPYLLYGTLYFVFLFIDRLVSWLGTDLGPFAVNFNRSYQIGVDLALLMLVPITAVKFPAIYRLSEYLEKSSKDTLATDPSAFAKMVASFHDRLMMRVLVASVAFTFLAFVFADAIVGFAGGGSESVTVFRIALVGIILFSVFLGNAVFAMAFRRIGVMGVLLLVACFVNYALSLAFSDQLGPDGAVMGFVLSTLFLAATSFIYVFDMRRAQDYAYYTAA